MTVKPFGQLPGGKHAHLYSIRCGSLETQYYPDAVHHPQWPQPVVKAGQKYFSETKYIFAQALPT